MENSIIIPQSDRSNLLYSVLDSHRQAAGPTLMCLQISNVEDNLSIHGELGQSTQQNSVRLILTLEIKLIEKMREIYFHFWSKFTKLVKESRAAFEIESNCWRLENRRIEIEMLLCLLINY